MPNSSGRIRYNVDDGIDDYDDDDNVLDGAMWIKDEPTTHPTCDAGIAVDRACFVVQFLMGSIDAHTYEALVEMNDYPVVTKKISQNGSSNRVNDDDGDDEDTDETEDTDEDTTDDDTDDDDDEGKGGGDNDGVKVTDGIGISPTSWPANTVTDKSLVSCMKGRSRDVQVSPVNGGPESVFQKFYQQFVVFLRSLGLEQNPNRAVALDGTNTRKADRRGLIKILQGSLGSAKRPRWYDGARKSPDSSIKPNKTKTRPVGWGLLMALGRRRAQMVRVEGRTVKIQPSKSQTDPAYEVQHLGITRTVKKTTRVPSPRASKDNASTAAVVPRQATPPKVGDRSKSIGRKKTVRFTLPNSNESKPNGKGHSAMVFSLLALRMKSGSNDFIESVTNGPSEKRKLSRGNDERHAITKPDAMQDMFPFGIVPSRDERTGVCWFAVITEVYDDESESYGYEIEIWSESTGRSQLQVTQNASLRNEKTSTPQTTSKSAITPSFTFGGRQIQIPYMKHDFHKVKILEDDPYDTESSSGLDDSSDLSDGDEDDTHLGNVRSESWHAR